MFYKTKHEKQVILIHHSSVKNGLDSTPLCLFCYLFLFLNKIVSEYKNSSLFYLSSKYSLLDCYRGNLNSKFQKEEKKKRLMCPFSRFVKNPLLKASISLIYHCRFSVDQLTAEIKLTNGKAWIRFSLLFFFSTLHESPKNTRFTLYIISSLENLKFSVHPLTWIVSLCSLTITWPVYRKWKGKKISLLESGRIISIEIVRKSTKIQKQKKKKSRERKIEINHLHTVSIKRYMQFRKKRLSMEIEKLDLSEKYRICQLS